MGEQQGGQATGPSIVVMTANLAAGLAPDDQVVAAIHRERPHIVAFQELVSEQATRLERALHHDYAHTSFIADGNEGRGILSRFPIAWAHPMEISEGRPDVVALIDVHGQDLFVVVAHPRPQKMTMSGLFFSFGSKRQILRLGQITTDAPTGILLGDLNMSPRHPGYARLRDLGLVDAYAAKGEGAGNTFPTRVSSLRKRADRLARQKVPPLVRFDYIFCTPNIDIDSAWIGTDTGSDHAPVLAKLRLPALDPSNRDLPNT
jgi:endonuclease/exonuclease/phosphatase family metal-dependent hydrolase